MSALNKIVLNLLEATITLYPANASGAPVVDSPIWTGVGAERLTAREKWISVETRPTGARYPKNHPLVAQYNISIGRVWALQLADLIGFQPVDAQYVLDVVWKEEDTGHWHRRVFYGVTIDERSLESREIDGGFTDDQIFMAQYYVPDYGSGAVSSISTSLPYRVYWTGLDGSRLLYTYDPDTHIFTAAAAGITTGRATIALNATYLEVLFSGDSTPALKAADDGIEVVGGIHALFANQSKIPRLDFYYGAQRIVTITQEGLWDTEFVEGTPALAAGKFGIYGNGVLIATLAASVVSAKSFEVV